MYETENNHLHPDGSGAKYPMAPHHRLVDYKKKLELQQYNRLYYRNRNKCKKQIYYNVPQVSEPITLITEGKFIIEL